MTRSAGEDGTMTKRFSFFVFAVFLAAAVFAGCAKKQVVTEAGVTEPEVVVEAEPAPAPEPVAPEPAPVAPKKLESVYFDFDRYSIRTDAVEALRNNAEIIKANGGRVIIEGHCDERGTSEYNMALGESRARAVKDYLTTLGVDPASLRIISYGDEKPFCRDHTEQCWQSNRRANFMTGN